jgi:hypothetical protein
VRHPKTLILKDFFLRRLLARSLHGGEAGDHPVHLLREGGEYLTKRLRQERNKLLVIAAGGLFVSLSLSLLVHPVVGISGALLTAVCAHRSFRNYAAVQKGLRGERLVTERLAELPSDFFVINDILLPNHKGNIDHVVIGPCGVVVIETKHYRGSVKIFRDHWYHNGHERRSASKQANCGAIALREFLSAGHPDLKSSVLRFVETIVVLVDPLSHAEIHSPTTTVVRYSQILDVILEKARRRHVSPSVTRRLADTLATVVPRTEP